MVQKDVRTSLILPEELWKKLSHTSIEQGKSKNELIVELNEKGLKS